MGTMILAMDIDGTLTSAPKALGFLCEAWKRHGGEVHIVTACHAEPTDEDYAIRKQQLAELGIVYDDIYIAPPPVARNKSRYLKTVGANLFIDNRTKNAVMAAEVTNSCLFLGDNDDEDEPDPYGPKG